MIRKSEDLPELLCRESRGQGPGKGLWIFWEILDQVIIDSGFFYAGSP
jgi:hypothetical protein